MGGRATYGNGSGSRDESCYNKQDEVVLELHGEQG